MQMLSMEIQVSFALLAGLLALILSWKLKKNKILPPSPKALPIIGHLHLLSKILHHSLTDLSKQFGPLMLLKLGSRPALIVSSSDMAREVLSGTNFLSRPQFVATREIIYNGIGLGTSSYGQLWKDTRKISTMELFTYKHLNTFTTILKEEIKELLGGEISAAAKSNSKLEVRQCVRGLQFNVMTRMLMSKSYFGDQHGGDQAKAVQFVEYMDEIMQTITRVTLGDMFPRLAWLDHAWTVPRMRKLHKKVDAFLQKVVDEHRLNHNSYGDFVDVLDSHFGIEREDCTKATLLDLTLGGTDTTSTLIEWAMGELLNNPHMMEKIQKELESVVGIHRMVEEGDIPKLEYLNAVVKETLRLHPPVPVTFRSPTTSGHKVLGYDIPKDSIVFVNIYAIGRDPKGWQDPETFDPERFIGKDIDVVGRDYDLLPFGSGRRVCVGIQVAMRNAPLTLANLVHHFNWSFPTGKTQHSMVEHFGLTNNMAEPLEARVSARL